VKNLEIILIISNVICLHKICYVRTIALYSVKICLNQYDMAATLNGM